MQQTEERPKMQPLELDTETVKLLHEALSKYVEHLRLAYFEIPKKDKFGRNRAEDSIKYLDWIAKNIIKPECQFRFIQLIAEVEEIQISQENKNLSYVPNEARDYIGDAIDYELATDYLNYFFDDTESQIILRNLNFKIKKLLEVKTLIHAYDVLASASS